MMPDMSAPKKKKPDAPKGRGSVFNLRLGPEREAVLNRYIAMQDVPPEKTAVLLRAFEKFMAEKGLWPPGD